MARILESTMKYLPALVAVSAALPHTVLSAPIEINGIAAKVNGHVVTKQEVRFHLQPTVGLLRAKYPRMGEQFHKALNEAKDEVLDQLIDNKLVLSKLEELDAQLPDLVIDEEIQRIVREVFNGSEEAFRDNLKKSGMSRRSFRESQREMTVDHMVALPIRDQGSLDFAVDLIGFPIDDNPGSLGCLIGDQINKSIITDIVLY